MPDPGRTPPADFDGLSVDEQIEYVQSLWDRIAAHPSRVPVPDWHLRELQDRERANRLSPQQASSWDEVHERLRRRAGDDK